MLVQQKRVYSADGSAITNDMVLSTLVGSFTYQAMIDGTPYRGSYTIAPNNTINDFKLIDANTEIQVNPFATNDDSFESWFYSVMCTITGSCS